MKIEHDKMNIEKEKVVLETKVKHIGEQSKRERERNASVA